MSYKKTELSEDTKSTNLRYLSSEEAHKISYGFELLQITKVPLYSNSDKFVQDLQKIPNPQYENVKFFTSGSTVTPKE